MNQALPDTYVQKNKANAERQLVLAGFRLAKTIEMIFNPKAKVAENQSFL